MDRLAKARLCPPSPTAFFNYVDVYNFTTRKKRDIMISGITPHKIPNFII